MPADHGLRQRVSSKVASLSPWLAANWTRWASVTSRLLEQWLHGRGCGIGEEPVGFHPQDGVERGSRIVQGDAVGRAHAYAQESHLG